MINAYKIKIIPAHTLKSCKRNEVIAKIILDFGTGRR
jgi:hypothetical protein